MASASPCPACGRPAAPRAANRAYPFCSDRCRLLDLGKWLGEEFRIPGGRPGDGAVPSAPENPEDES
ncbi:MAG TPA: DNA gyrase inhibitor YacG [Anaeromyxobacteraceae bacterium]|nr:DNA gyrase inhibitor YacG [Anaeromyxobacteraceae bacterium]